MDGMDRVPALTEQAARVLAEIHGLEAALDGAELVVTGSTGQPKGNPLLAELRAHRVLLLRLLGVFAPEGTGPAEDVVDEIRRSWEAGSGV
jgi:hypothetical protein